MPNPALPRQKDHIQSRRLIRSAISLALACFLLSNLGMQETRAAAASPAPPAFKELASSCGPDTLKSVLIGGASIVYDQLYGARSQDAARIKKVCGIIQAFAASGKPKTPFDPTPESFFYGYSLTFSNGGGASIFEWVDGLYLESGTTFVNLKDEHVHKAYKSLFVTTDEVSMEPASPRFGENIRLKGHDPLLFAPDIYVYWTPAAETYTSSGSNGYPSDTSLLIGTGKQQFGYFDLSLTLPPYGKALDGTMKRLGSEGSFNVMAASGTNGNSYIGGLSLLPARNPFLSVDGKPALDASLRPILRDERALLPLRSIAKLAGKSIVWDKDSWSALIRSEPPAPRTGVYSFPQLWIDGKLAPPELQPILRDGLTYVPIRALTAAFGISVSWSPVSRSVDIELPSDMD